MPLSEMLVDFYDHLKSRTQGYASMDYSLTGYRRGDLVRLDILVNEEPVDALSVIVHRAEAYKQGKALVTRLKELIPRQLFEVPIQAAVGSKVQARETVKAPSARTSWPSATAVTSPASASSFKSRPKVRSE